MMVLPQQETAFIRRPFPPYPAILPSPSATRVLLAAKEVPSLRMYTQTKAPTTHNSNTQPTQKLAVLQIKQKEVILFFFPLISNAFVIKTTIHLLVLKQTNKQIKYKSNTNKGKKSKTKQKQQRQVKVDSGLVVVPFSLPSLHHLPSLHFTQQHLLAFSFVPQPPSSSRTSPHSPPFFPLFLRCSFRVPVLPPIPFLY